MKRRTRHSAQEADLDITAFMNLMIVLVPILLLGMVFSRITQINVTLPPDASYDSVSVDQQIELVLKPDGMQINYPRGIPLKTIAMTASGDYDFALLSLVLQEIKRQLIDKGITKKSITLMPMPDIDYQTIVTAMDTVRSFKAVVAASVVDAELFPEILFGDAPQAVTEHAG